MAVEPAGLVRSAGHGDGTDEPAMQKELAGHCVGVAPAGPK